MKPKMPPKGERPYVMLVLKAELSFDPARYSSGNIGMGFDRVRFTDAENKEVGYVEFCFGGIMIHDDLTKRTYSFGAAEIWRAFNANEEIIPKEKTDAKSKTTAARTDAVTGTR